MRLKLTSPEAQAYHQHVLKVVGINTYIFCSVDWLRTQNGVTLITIKLKIEQMPCSQTEIWNPAKLWMYLGSCGHVCCWTLYHLSMSNCHSDFIGYGNLLLGDDDAMPGAKSLTCLNFSWYTALLLWQSLCSGYERGSLEYKGEGLLFSA